jgi:hypothetical protein
LFGASVNGASPCDATVVLPEGEIDSYPTSDTGRDQVLDPAFILSR